MKLRNYLIKGLLALAAFFSMLGVANSQNLIWQGNICWQNVSSYDVVRVHFQPTNNSWWDTNMTVNGRTIASVGNGSSYSGYTEVPGSGISLGWVKVGCGAAFGLCASYRPSLNTGQCNPVFEDTGISPTEGYFWFEGAKYVRAALSVTKSASPPYFAVGASGQSYNITISVSNGPTTQAIAVTDNLPVGITTRGPITATGGVLSGCPSAGSANLTGCTIAAGTYGPISITVPVDVTAAASSHSNIYAYNIAYASGGGPTSCANGTCQGATNNAVINAIDDSDSKPAGVPSSTDVSANDANPAGSTFTATGGSCTNPSPFNPTANTTGILSYTLPAGSQSCTVEYKLCAPAPYASICDTATLTVNLRLPSITVTKAISGTGRVSATDQFAVQILQNNAVVNNTLTSTTTGSGTVVTAGSGTTGRFTTTANTSYTLNEVASNGAILGRYTSSVNCTLDGTPLPALSLGGTITPTGSETYICTITNKPKAATLTVRQMVLGPVPVNLLPPYRFDYTGTNGWAARPLTDTALNVLVTSSTDPLTAFNTATTVSTKLPEPRWFVSVFSCNDTNAAISGNPTGVLVTAKATSITIPATYVRPGAALRCTMALGHLTP